MKENEILEGNELIAKFIGSTITKQTLFEKDENLETLVVDVYSRPEFFNDDLYNLFGWLSYENLDRMRYHSSWDWLMPVVEEIESTKFDANIGWVDFHIMPDAITVNKQEDEDNPLIIINLSDCMGSIEKEPIYYHGKIQATYQAVIEFIKWYNKQQS